jgi:hypothetical protein
MTDPTGTAVALRSSQRGNDSVLDKIRLTLNHAAEVLRESLELTVGGVVFLDTAIGYTDTSNAKVTAADKIEERGDGLLEAGGAIPSLSRHNDKIGRHLSKQSIRSSADKHKPAVSYSGSRTCRQRLSHKLCPCIMSQKRGFKWSERLLTSQSSTESASHGGSGSCDLGSQIESSRRTDSSVTHYLISKGQCVVH